MYGHLFWIHDSKLGIINGFYVNYNSRVTPPEIIVNKELNDQDYDRILEDVDSMYHQLSEEKHFPRL